MQVSCIRRGKVLRLCLLHPVRARVLVGFFTAAFL